MLKLSRVFIILLIVTIVWAVLLEIYTEEYTAYVKHTGHFPAYPSYFSIFLIVGFVLFSVWAIASAVKRSIKVMVALIGIVIASFFFIVATTENIGYSLEHCEFQINGSGYFIYTLNPFLHVGGERITTVFGSHPTSEVVLNSLSMKNLLLNTAYGESISFSLMKIYLLTKKQYFKAHSIEKIMILIGATIAIITLCCDLIAVCGLPPLIVKIILTQWQKPMGTSILPPTIQYYIPSLPSYYEPLSSTDLFSLYFPIFYLVFLIIEIFRYHRWKIKISINEETIQVNKKTATL